MQTQEKVTIKLNLDDYYSESDLISLEMIPLNDHGMDYYTFERNSKVYFFEKTKQKLYRLFCTTSRQSFYLS